MAKLLQPFNARQFNPEQGTGGFPIGKHLVAAVKSEVKPTKGNDGGYLQYDLQILQGEHQGTVGAYRLNLYNSSQAAVDIAHRQFSAMCHVCGVFDVQDSSQLHNIPFMIEVGLQKGENPNKYTEVKKLFDANGNEPGQQGGGASAAQQQPQGQQQQPVQQQPQGGQAAGWGQQQPQGQQAPAQGAQGGGWGQQPQGGQQPAQGVANNVPMPGNGQPPQGQQPPQQAWGQQPANNQPANGWGQQPNGQAGQASWGQ